MTVFTKCPSCGSDLLVEYLYDNPNIVESARRFCIFCPYHEPYQGVKVYIYDEMGEYRIGREDHDDSNHHGAAPDGEVSRSGIRV